MTYGPTVNLVSDRLVACYLNTCEIFQDGTWKHLQNTTVTRVGHSIAASKDAILLIGGIMTDNIGHYLSPTVYTNTTEWIPVDGSAARQGPFTVGHGHDHCTIQLSADIIVVTGGAYTWHYVTEYQLADGKETILTSLQQPRYTHACGFYQETGGNQVQ